MADILTTIADYTKIRVENDKKQKSLEELISLCQGSLPYSREDFAFEKTLKKQGLSFICEVKKASPSKGIITNDFPYTKIAEEYESAGADCVSCLTEPKWFLGSDEIFVSIRQSISIPMLRKDFTVDEYQIYQAKLMGADAVLLICSLLDDKTVKEYIGICNNLGLSALVEAHNEQEIKSAVNAGARIIGVNNRNLKDFSVDPSNCLRLRDKIPDNILFVAESGVKSSDDTKMLKNSKVDAVLIGEAMMKAENKTKFLAELKG
ncbi:MAG: indole-3-glycerol phosphate synthase TrpC [Clostridia bacterium]|nr:indole-3-glycerol phosphate synthase TrpC [Clostridia bacterium]